MADIEETIKTTSKLWLREREREREGKEREKEAVVNDFQVHLCMI